MRILSIVTLVSPDGAYGGPLRVAVNQASMLQERGHEVTIVAAERGFAGSPPVDLDGVRATLFPARRVVPRTGFAGLASPAMLSHLRRRVTSFDVVHVHVARDLVTLPAAAVVRRAGVPYLVQPHGMIDASSNPLARVLDPALTVPILRDAYRVLYLTGTEREALAETIGNDANLHPLTNGVPPSDLVADPTTPEVLYLARLAGRKRPGMVVDVANALAADFPEHRYRFVGPDEGEVARLQHAMSGSAADVAWEGPLAPAQTLARMSRAGLYVLPSVDEPYCMTVLEAMSVGLPVVITESNGLAPVVRRTGAGIVAGTDSASLVEAVRTVLADPEAARRMGAAGRAAARGELGMDAIASELESLYVRASALRTAGN